MAKDSTTEGAYMLGLEHGAREEREAVIEWMREHWSERYAKYIEAGEHLK